GARSRGARYTERAARGRRRGRERRCRRRRRGQRPWESSVLAPESLASLGFGRVRLASAASVSRLSGLGASRLEVLLALLDRFLRRDVLDATRERPAVAERILEDPVAIAPELVCHRAHDL